jgi:hypothetical protein
LALVAKMSEKCKCTSPSGIQVKNLQITTEEKLDIISQLKKGDRIFKYAVMLDLFIVAYVQLVIMPIRVQKVDKSGTKVSV